jgi:hypothetical protein
MKGSTLREIRVTFLCEGELMGLGTHRYSVFGLVASRTLISTE